MGEGGGMIETRMSHRWMRSEWAALSSKNIIYTWTGRGLFRFKPRQQIVAMQLPEQLYRGILGKASNGGPDSLLWALLYYIFKQHLSIKPSVHLHSAAKKTEQLPDLPEWLQTTFPLPSPSQTK